MYINIRKTMTTHTKDDPYVTGLTPPHLAEYNMFLIKYDVNDNTQANEVTTGLFGAIRSGSVASLFDFRHPRLMLYSLFIMGVSAMIATILLLLLVLQVSIRRYGHRVIWIANLKRLGSVCLGCVMMLIMTVAFGTHVMRKYGAIYSTHSELEK